MNKTAMIGAVIVLLIVVIAAGYLLMGNKSAAPNIPVTSTVTAPTSAYTTIAGSNSSSSLASTTVAPSTYSIELESNATYGGQYLANASGYTLYVYKSDVPNSGASSCSGGCANVWPPFYVSNFTVAPGLNASSFGIINRTGSGTTHQLTYKGWPLYRYVQDTKTGQISGNGIANFQLATK